MVNQLRILLSSMLLTIASFSAIPAVADSAPSVLGSYAEQFAINKTRFILLFDSPIEELTLSDFQASAGCTIAHLEIQDATAQVELVDCPSGLVQLTLLANSVGSSARGPAENHVVSIEIDAIPPTANFTAIQVLGAGPFTYATNLRFSEQVDFDISRLQFSSDTACTNTATAFENGWRLLAVCDFATLSWSLPPNVLLDGAGNRGPVSSVQVSLSHLRPASLPPAPAETVPSPPPVVNPEPAPPVQTPSLELPAAAQEVAPTLSSTVSESAVSASTQSEHIEWDAEWVSVTITPPPAIEPIAGDSTAGPLLSAIEQGSVPAVMEALKPADETETKVAIAPVAGESVEFEDPRRGQWILLVGLGSLALLATGLIRRFSGR